MGNRSVVAKAAVVESSTLLPDPEPIFFLTGGFEATEYRILPDTNGAFEATIAIRG